MAKKGLLMEWLQIAKLVLTALVVSMLLKTLASIILFKVRSAAAALPVVASQYLTATLSVLVMCYFAPLYVSANPEMYWIRMPAVAIMFLFSVVIEAIAYSSADITERPYTMAFVLNLLTFAAFFGLSLIGAMPAII